MRPRNTVFFRSSHLSIRIKKKKKVKKGKMEIKSFRRGVKVRQVEAYRVLNSLTRLDLESSKNFKLIIIFRKQFYIRFDVKFEHAYTRIHIRIT